MPVFSPECFLLLAGTAHTFVPRLKPPRQYGRRRVWYPLGVKVTECSVRAYATPKGDDRDGEDPSWGDAFHAPILNSVHVRCTFGFVVILA